MKILLLEPYLTGSHKTWTEDYARFSSHEIKIMSMSGHYWKWRMHGGAITLARKFLQSEYIPDLIIASDMLDLSTFLGMTRSVTAHIPTVLYFHENQLSYPWSPTDQDINKKRDDHYSFINYSSAMVADKVLFNSAYHMNSFFEELPLFLKKFPDHNELNSPEILKQKSRVLHLGMDLNRVDHIPAFEKEKPNRAVILWNHRWEYDKNPKEFFKALFELDERGVEFKLILIGENFSMQPECFERAKTHFGDRILKYGYVESYEEYIQWVKYADILPVTSNHDFFGVSVVEAMYCDVIPLLPRRLSYPEHIPEKYASTFFYDDYTHLVNRLQRLIFDVRILRNQKMAHFVEKYEWGTIVTQYDSMFEQLLNKSNLISKS